MSSVNQQSFQARMESTLHLCSCVNIEIQQEFTPQSILPNLQNQRPKKPKKETTKYIYNMHSAEAY